MAFNPISIESGGGSSLLARRRTAANGGLPNPAGGDVDGSVSSPFLVAPNATLSHAERQCKDNFYFEYPWRVPMPEHPAAPLLYAPQAYKDLLHASTPLPVMQCEVGAMSAGVLESIPLAYYPLRLDAVQEMRDAALRTQYHIDAMQQRAKEAGQVDLVTWRPQDVNPTLAPADLALLDTDMDQSLVLQKDIPSLSLLQRPIYTEMGLVPEAQRHELRVARIVPQSLSALNPNGSPVNPASPGPAAASNTAGFTSAAGSANADPAQSWAAGVQDSFRLARTLDEQFNAFIALLAQRKLGLDRTDPAHTELARTIWVALTSSNTTSEEKHLAWHSLCHFSTHYGETTHEKAVAALHAHQREGCRTFEKDKTWTAKMKAYTACVKAYVSSLKGGVAERKRQLHVANSELDARVPVFQPELETGVLLRRQGESMSSETMPVTIYPVEVLPVFPSGFDLAAEQKIVNAAKSSNGELDFLAESFSDVHHLVLPGAVGVGGPARTEAPHILVGGANLLLTEPASMGEGSEALTEDERLAKAAGAIVPGGTMSYGTRRMNTFQPLYEDPDSTASYVVHVHDAPSREDKSGMTRSGAASADGRYVTYDRVGVLNVFTKANNPEQPVFDRYVVVFDDDKDMVPVELTEANNASSTSGAGHKRVREVDDEESEDEAKKTRLS